MIFKVISFILFTVILGIIAVFEWFSFSGQDFVTYIKNINYSDFFDFLAVNKLLFIVVIILSVILYMLRKSKALSSNFCKRTSIYITFKIKNPFMYFKFIKTLHELEHLFIKHKKIYDEQNSNTNTIFESEKHTIEDILLYYQKIFNFISKDVSINFKHFIGKKNLKTYVRIKSKYEQNLFALDPEGNRSKLETFTYTKIETNRLEEHYSKNSNLKKYLYYNPQTKKNLKSVSILLITKF